MSLTLNELLDCEERLQTEIAERESFLAAIRVLKGYAEKGQRLRGIEIGVLGNALLSSNRTNGLLAEAPAHSNPPQPVPEVTPAPPQPKRYIHPELVPYDRLQHGKNTGVVGWAIQRMTGDFTLKDIRKLLTREGVQITNAQLSVVLTRFKNRGQIKEIKVGRGPVPSVFQGPQISARPMNKTTGTLAKSEEEPAVKAA